MSHECQKPKTGKCCGKCNSSKLHSYQQEAVDAIAEQETVTMHLTPSNADQTKAFADHSKKVKDKAYHDMFYRSN